MRADEEWIPVDGYEGLYEASDLGRVRRLAGTPRCAKTRLIKPVTKKRGGYLAVFLWRDGIGKEFRLNRLIYQAFSGRSLPPEIDVHHKNTIIADNKFSNLEELPEGEHHHHPAHRRLRGSQVSSSVLSEDVVLSIRKYYSVGVRGCGYRAVANRHGISVSSVRAVVTGKTWKHIQSAREAGIHVADGAVL